jgi:hypothetical protein
MRIDKTHKSWAAIAASGIVAAGAVYFTFERATGAVPAGGSAPGLFFGATGYLLMLYAAALGLRRKFPIRRLGRASTWMRAHLWLGFLALPLLLLHSGFVVRGVLTWWLVALLIATIATGIVGAVAQHYLPKLMTRLVPLETIYEEIPRVQQKLASEAEALISAAGFDGEERPGWMTTQVGESTAVQSEIDIRIREIYTQTVRPFLSDPGQVRNPCSNQEECAALFSSLRVSLPPSSHRTLVALEEICDEARQLNRQKFLYRCLHYWLLAHVPLSLALIVLGGIHAVVALRYVAFGI